MPEIFLTADTHFGHTNILTYESSSRPFTSIEEHDEALVEKWNGCVKSQDTVWHLGDVAWTAKDLGTLNRLNGHKKLVLGNHDVHASRAYLDIFNKIFGVFELKKIAILSHIPLHPAEFSDKEVINLHGHLHSRRINDPRYLNVGVDRWGLAPVSWETIKQYIIGIK